MIFDATLNLGQLLTLMATIIGGSAVVVTLRSDLRAVVARVANVERAIEKQTDILVLLGKQEVRLDSLEKRLARVEDHTSAYPSAVAR